MRIALRTSGGRGEYELAGSQGNIFNHDIADRHIYFQLSPTLIVPGLQALRLVQGKPRIRIIDGAPGIHAYRLLSSILLLPKPIRELSKTSDSEHVMVNGRYSILGIDVDVLNFDQDTALLRPKSIIAGNRSNIINKISISERMAGIYQLWVAAENHDSPVSPLILSHKAIVLQENPSHKEIEKAADRIREAAGETSNIVRHMVGMLDAEESTTDDEGVQVVQIPEGDQELAESEHDTDTTLESSREQLYQWRKVLSRGKDGRRFSQQIKEAYDFRCAFTGKRLPATETILVPGVDACHILPWAEHHINDLANGICLNKLCHWAFDSGILRLDWDNDRYVISVPENVVVSAENQGVDLDYFRGLEGEVHKQYLPQNPALWPRPEFLVKLNQYMFQ